MLTTGCTIAPLDQTRAIALSAERCSKPFKGLDKTFHFLEKLLHHHLGHTVEHALTDAGDKAADFGIGAVLEQRLTALFFPNRWPRLLA